MKGEHLVSEKRAPTIVRLADVEPQEVQWLWWPYIPLGKITLVEGDPGIGKTFLMLYLSAILSRGWGLPDQSGAPSGRTEPTDVLYMTAEDGLGDTLRPRLEAAGADVSRVHALTGWSEVVDGETAEGAVFLSETAIIREALERIRPSLLVVDPLQAFLGAQVDMHRANEVRPLLSGLGKLAEEYGCAVVGVRHLGKSFKGRAIYSGLGSIDFAAAARSVLLVGEHRGEKLMAHVKSSLAPAGKSLRYVLRDGALEWAGVSDVTPDDMLVRVTDASESSREDEAKDFLSDMLSEGPQPAKELFRLAREAGIAKRTLERAKSALGVTSERVGRPGADGGWAWKAAIGQEVGGLGALREESRPEQEESRPPHGVLSGGVSNDDPLRAPLRPPIGGVEERRP